MLDRKKHKTRCTNIWMIFFLVPPVRTYIRPHCILNIAVCNYELWTKTHNNFSLKSELPHAWKEWRKNNWKLQVNNSHRWTLNIDNGKNGIERSNGQTRIQWHRMHSHSATLICSLISRLVFFYQTKAHIFIVNLFYLFCAIRLSFAYRCLWLCSCSCSCSARFECSIKWLEKWNVHCLLMFVWFVHLCLSRTQVSESRKCLFYVTGKHKNRETRQPKS